MYLITVIKEADPTSSYNVDKEKKLVEYRTEVINIPALMEFLGQNSGSGDPETK